MLADLHFLRPQWLLALVPLALLLFWLWRRRPGESVWRGLVDPHLLPHLLARASGRERRLPFVLLGAGWLISVVALAGPTWERLPQPVFGTSAKRVILLDLSPSMNAADVSPSRLARARFKTLDLLRATREGQVALVAFGPEPFVVSPLSGDAQTIAAQVPRLASELVPLPGPRRTDLALEQASGLLRQAGAEGGEVLLIADALGDKPGAEDSAIAEAKALADKGIRVSVLAVGTAQGAPEPGRDGGFVRDDKGSVRIARLDRSGLQALARAGNGIYAESVAADRDIQAILAASGSAARQQSALQPGLSADQWREEGPWLLLALLPLAALAFRRGWLLPMFALAFVLPPTPGMAMGWDELWQRPDQQAARSLATGDNAAAAARFQDSAWRAAARYRSGDYAGALQDLSGARGPEADYNRGNALARLGQLDQAIDAYRKALAQAPDDQDARDNLALVERLKAEKEKQKQNESSKPDEQKKQGKQSQGSQTPDDDGKSQDSEGGQSSAQNGQGKDGSDDRQRSEASRDRQSSADRQGQNGSQARDQAGQSGAAQSPVGKQGSDRSAEQSSGQQDPSSDNGGKQGGDKDSAESKSAQSSPSSAASGGQGASQAPSASDFGASALGDRKPPALSDAKSQPGAAAGAAAAERDGQQAASAGMVAAPADLTPAERERQQSMEAQLRRVPDDPAGLLRQRFMLQHLRREGRLP
jgi:Ca-activated chloride channel homolog